MQPTLEKTVTQKKLAVRKIHYKRIGSVVTRTRA